MQIFLMNVPTDTERLERFQAVYPSILPTYNVHAALTGDEVTPPDWWKTTANRWALVQNNINILKSVDKSEPVLIFEDDACFCENFETLYNDFLANIPENADMAYLGGWHIDNGLNAPIKVTDKILRGRSVLLDHAKIIFPKAIDRVIAWYEMENWGCQHAQDWRNVQLHLMNDFYAYCPFVFMVGQAGGLVSTLDELEKTVDEYHNEYQYWDDGILRNSPILQEKREAEALSLQTKSTLESQIVIQQTATEILENF